MNMYKMTYVYNFTFPSMRAYKACIQFGTYFTITI